MMDKRTAEMDGAGFEAIKLRYASFTPPFQTLWLIGFFYKINWLTWYICKNSIAFSKKVHFVYSKLNLRSKYCLQEIRVSNSVADFVAMEYSRIKVCVTFSATWHFNFAKMGPPWNMQSSIWNPLMYTFTLYIECSMHPWWSSGLRLGITFPIQVSAIFFLFRYFSQVSMKKSG